jgi:hypothetical protein
MLKCHVFRLENSPKTSAPAHIRYQIIEALTDATDAKDVADLKAMKKGDLAA